MTTTAWVHAPDQIANMYTDASDAITETPITPALRVHVHLQKKPKLTVYFALTHQAKVNPLPIQHQPTLSQVPSTLIQQGHRK